MFFRSNNLVSLYVILAVLLGGCTNQNTDTEDAIESVREQCESRISNEDSWDSPTINMVYDLDLDWEYQGSELYNTYSNGFFFLFEKETTFQHNFKDSLEMIINSVYSCSGVPPHLTVLERSFFNYNRATHDLTRVKKLVNEESELVKAPTELDESIDIMYQMLKYEESEN